MYIDTPKTIDLTRVYIYIQTNKQYRSLFCNYNSDQKENQELTESALGLWNNTQSPT